MMSKKAVHSIIVAYDENRVIGANGQIPWSIPADLQRFKRLTSGCPVIMGRATFESIGRPLPNRKNIVLSSKQSFRPEGVTVARNMDEAIEEAESGENVSEVFHMGGESEYAEALAFADRIYATEVKGMHSGDTYFPEIERDDWEVVDTEDHEPQGETPGYRYVTYEREH